ncbi:hypothetical protein MKW92_014825 [Papaver armeniacum]|nr:hypothetical protein MKW92_014825 [Papaver armeniacum]
MEDIEIVNLARIRPEEIDMTIVSKNFNLLHINSIPLDSLDCIRRILDGWSVKFYENNLNLNWGSIMKNIEENPEGFIRKGGWDAYELEDKATLRYYKHYYLNFPQAPMEHKHMIWG